MNNVKIKNLSKCPWCGCDELRLVEDYDVDSFLTHYRLICRDCGAMGPSMSSLEEKVNKILNKNKKKKDDRFGKIRIPT